MTRVGIGLHKQGLVLGRWDKDRYKQQTISFSTSYVAQVISKDRGATAAKTAAAEEASVTSSSAAESVAISGME